MPEDGGLFLPESIAPLEAATIDALGSMSFMEIAQAMATSLLSEDIPAGDLNRIVAASMDLDVRLNRLSEHMSVLETFHGPTMAFKDFGARFMARLMAYLIQEDDGDLTILVATSGDTGSAVASGFLGVPGIRVVILYPSGKVSPSQEKQLTTQGQNIQVLEVSGTFDDCQRLVKEAFADRQLRQEHQLSSANSINIARLIPQSFYYAYAAGKFMKENDELVISVPSGNFGNLTAGLIAKRMGVPISHFIASTNSNDVFPEYLRTGVFEPRPSNQTMSNAMDVGDPSNLARIRYLFDDDVNRIMDAISSWSFGDAKTRETMGKIHQQFGYIIDPHTAVGILGLNEYYRSHPSKAHGVVISTAHPAKFPESVEPIIGEALPIPPLLAQYLGREKNAMAMSTRYKDFRQYLKDTLG